MANTEHGFLNHSYHSSASVLILSSNIKVMHALLLFSYKYDMWTNAIPIEFFNYFKRCFLEIKGIAGKKNFPFSLLCFFIQTYLSKNLR